MEEVEGQERILTITNYDEEHGKFTKTDITISPSCVEFLVSRQEIYETVEGREIRKVNIMLVSGNNLEVFISALDLAVLQRCVGNYYLP